MSNLQSQGLNMKVLRMVFGRLGWPNGSELHTLKAKGGMILPDSHPLANYGLGSLLQNWELEVVKKEEGKHITLHSSDD